MAKIIIPNKNSTWGVINNPVSANVYQHIINWKNDVVRDEWVSKEFFGGTALYTLFTKNAVVRSFTRETTLKASFKLDLAQYNTTMGTSHTEERILNMDFVIIESKGKRYYYVVNEVTKGALGQRNQNTYLVTCELDIFMTYDVKKMFNSNPARVRQAHLDRFYYPEKLDPVPVDYKYLDNYRSVLFSERDHRINNPIFNDEQISQNMDDITVPASEPMVLHPDYDDIIFKEDGVTKPQAGQLTHIYERLSKMRLGIYADTQWSSRIFDNPAPYLLKAGLLSTEKYKFDIEFVDNAWNKIGSIGYIEKSVIEDAHIYKSGYTVSWLNFLAEHKGLSSDEIRILDTANDGIKIQIQAFDLSGVGNFETHEYQLKGQGLLNLFTWIKGQVGVRLHKIWKPSTNNTSLDDESDLRSWSVRERSPIPAANIDDPRSLYNAWKAKKGHQNYKYEFKTHTFPYTKYELKTSSQNLFKIHPQLIFNGKYETSPYGTTFYNPYHNKLLDFKAGYGFQLETNSHFLEPLNYNQIYDHDNKNENNVFVDHTNYSLATNNDVWQDYIASNKAQQNAGWLNKGITAGVGVLGILAAPITGGMSLAATGIAGASLALSSAKGIVNQVAQRKDLQASPDKINSSASTLILDERMKGFNPKITRYELPPVIKNQVNQHFYKYGYNLTGRLYNINEIIHTRYHFNYVELEGCFENIHMALSGEIKQLIDSTFKNGVTIWHIDDYDHFNGIKTYDVENIELKLANAKLS